MATEVRVKPYLSLPTGPPAHLHRDAWMMRPVLLHHLPDGSTQARFLDGHEPVAGLLYTLERERAAYCVRPDPQREAHGGEIVPDPREEPPPWWGCDQD